MPKSNDSKIGPTTVRPSPPICLITNISDSFSPTTASTIPSESASSASRTVAYSRTMPPRCVTQVAATEAVWQPTVRPARSRGPWITPVTCSAVIVAVRTLVNAASRPMPPIIHAKAMSRPTGPSTCLSSHPPVTIVEAIHQIDSMTPRGYSGGNDCGLWDRSAHQSKWPESSARASTTPASASNFQESSERIAARKPVSFFCRTASRRPE